MTTTKTAAPPHPFAPFAGPLFGHGREALAELEAQAGRCLEHGAAQTAEGARLAAAGIDMARAAFAQLMTASRSFYDAVEHATRQAITVEPASGRAPGGKTVGA